MGELIQDTRFLQRWEQILLEAEQTREFALKKIGQFSLQLSGQLELPLLDHIEDPAG